MPFEQEHSARIIEPSKFDKNSFRRKNIEKGIDIIVGKLKGESKITTQAYRFKKDIFTVTQAKKWLKDHNITYILFEPAKKELSMDMENKLFAIDECKAIKAENGDVVLTGYANTKNKADRYGDIPTVFSEKRDFVYDLKEFKKNPVMLLDHRASIKNVAGSFEVIKEDEKGLYFEAKFSNSELSEIQHAKQVYLEGHAKALSIGGRWKFEDEKNPNHLTYAKIYEISLVAVPADPRALAEATQKALDRIGELKTLKDISTYLKDYKLSKAQVDGVMAKMRHIIKEGKPKDQGKPDIEIIGLINNNISDMKSLIKTLKGE